MDNFNGLISASIILTVYHATSCVHSYNPESYQMLYLAPGLDVHKVPEVICGPHCFRYSYWEKLLRDCHKLQDTWNIMCNSNSWACVCMFVVMNRYMCHPYNMYTIVLADVSIDQHIMHVSCIHCPIIVAIVLTVTPIYAIVYW